MTGPRPIPFTWTPAPGAADRHLHIIEVHSDPLSGARSTDIHVGYRYGKQGSTRIVRVALTPDGVTTIARPDDSPDLARTALLRAITGALTHHNVVPFLEQYAAKTDGARGTQAQRLVAALTLPDAARKVAITMLANGYTGTPDDLRTAATAATT